MRLALGRVFVEQICEHSPRSFNVHIHDKLAPDFGKRLAIASNISSSHSLNYSTVTE